MLFVNKEEIIEVAPHFFGGSHGCEDVEFFPLRISREDVWQHVCLDAGCHGQLRVQAGRFYLLLFILLRLIPDNSLKHIDGRKDRG